MAGTVATEQDWTRVGSRTVSGIREDFPILQRSVAGRGGAARPLAYLDNAATTQKPDAVIEAMSDFYRHSNANVHRSLHTLGEEATAAFEAAREAVRRFLNARTAAEIVFTRGTTEAINLVARSWGRASLHRGDEILLTEMEHHSNLIPWQLIAAETGAALRFLPVDRHGSLDLKDLERVWSSRVRIVAVTQVSNVFGTVVDVRRLADLAHERGVPLLVDGAQSVPHLPVDVQELGCDFLAFSGHKIYAPMGIGVLYGREQLLEAMPPYQGGGEMIRSVWPDRATWNDLPYKFEAGTPDVAAAVGLERALEYVTALGLPHIREYETQLADYARRRLAEVPGLTLHGPKLGGGPVISFTFPDLHPHDVAQALDWNGVAVRAGHHCAQPLMRKLGVPATVRASLSFYNTPQEVDRLTAGLREARRFFGLDGAGNGPGGDHGGSAVRKGQNDGARGRGVREEGKDGGEDRGERPELDRRPEEG
jgi:cysteine desulfurase/selenocysteine lyase